MRDYQLVPTQFVIMVLSNKLTYLVSMKGLFTMKLRHLLPIILLMPLVFSTPTTAKAATDTNWDKAVMTLGSSLTSQQKADTISTLNASHGSDDYMELMINGGTLVKYLNPGGSSFTNSSGVWSSARVQKTAAGSGIDVEILPFDGKNNITTITENQYKNAALTAGVTDAKIEVTSAVRIDGSGALAGVYAAFSQNGDALNQKQVDAAQNEMNTLSDITQANKGKDGYTDEQLNNAVAGAKEDMANKGTNITTGDITTIVNNQINQNNLTNVITNNQKTQIINMLVAVKNSGALNSDSFKNQASKLANNIQSGAKNIFDKLNTEQNRNFFQQILDSIGNFFTGIFDWVKSLF